jgi:hypothetical protein
MQENKTLIRLPQSYLDLLNQVFEIEKKASQLQEPNSISRNINKIKEIFGSIFSSDADGEAGLSYHNPIGERYNETRTELEASISGGSAEQLFIKEVIKPIIRYRKGGMNAIAQKGVVVVESININL